MQHKSRPRISVERGKPRADQSQLFRNRERRNSIRIPAAFDASIYLEDGHKQDCTIITISYNGMFLTTEHTTNFFLQRGHHATLEIFLEYDATFKRFFESTQIIHTEKNGIAVAFDRFNNTHCKILQMLFHILSSQNDQIESEHYLEDHQIAYKKMMVH